MIYYRIRPPSSEPLQTFKIRHFPSLRVFIPYQKAPFTAIGKWRSSYPVLTFDLYDYCLTVIVNESKSHLADFGGKNTVVL